jgi:tetratricopeptide (TPR) repeat protein
MGKAPFFARRRAAALVDEAHAKDDGGDQAGAWTLLEQALKDDPQSFDAEFLLGRIANDRAKFDLAAPHLERACALAPRAAHAFSELGRAYHQLGRRAEAEAAYSKSIGLKEDPYTMLNFATLLRDSGRFGEAAALYGRAVATGGLDPETSARVKAML